MGKSKTKRFGSLKPNPLGIVDEKNIDHEAQVNDEVSQNIPAALANIIEKLQSPSSEERACGCQLMASIVSQSKAVAYLLKENVVRMTGPLFLDECLDVRKSALGALRNMSVYGQADVSEVMIDHDILTPLTALLQKYSNGWLPDKEASKYDTNVDVLIEALELLSNLCESNNLAVKRFNMENLLNIILPLLNVDVYGYQLCSAVARCLFVVSENNNEVTSVCQKQDVVANLLKVINSDPPSIDAVLLRTLASGILLNLPQIDLSLHYKGIIKAVLEVLDMDTSTVINAALQSSQLASEESSLENEMAWPEVDKLLSAQGVGLELLANLCCSDDEWEDADGQDSEEVSSDDQTMDTEEENFESSLNTLCLPSEITSTFMEQNILSKILLKVSPLSEAQKSKLQNSHCGKTTLKKLHDLQTRALLCISNIVGAVDEALLSQSTPLLSVWTGLYELLSKDSSDEDFKWAITSALRAVIQRLSQVNAEDVKSIQASDIDFFVEVAKTSSNREIQINVIKIISTIGCIHSAVPDSFLQKIGGILLEVACHNEDVIIVSEALDSLFDVFKEDNTDDAAKEIGLVQQLVALQSSFNRRVKEKRKELGENYSVVMMAKSNLAGFIKYKLSTSASH